MRVKRVTERDDTTHQRIMRAWADRVLRAHAELPEDFEATETEQLVIDAVRWLGHCFWSGEAPKGNALDILHRLESSFLPEESDAKIAAAVAIIEDHGTRMARLGGPETGGYRDATVVWQSTPEDVAVSCIASLESQVSEGFGALDSQRAAVRDLLARYEPDQHRRRTPKGQPSKLGSAGLLVELNKLCKPKPLGSYSLSTGGIANALKRHRDRTASQI